MRTDHQAHFPTTHWTLIGQAGGSDTAAAEALSGVLIRYAPAMRAHLIRRKGLREHKAEDRLQEFLTVKFLEQQLISQAKQNRAKFRTFVLTALDRFLVSEHRRESAAKRGGNRNSVPLEDAETNSISATTDPSAPFDLEWGRQVIQAALARMKTHCIDIDRTDIWGVFDARVARPTLESSEPLEYAELVREYGFESPAQASNVLINAKRMFRRMLCSVIAEYACTEQEIEDEIRDLMTILSGR